MTDDEIVDAVVVQTAESKVPDVTRCQHANTKGAQCRSKAVTGYPLCQTHLEKASVQEIALVRQNDVTFSDIRGRMITNPLEELSLIVSEVLVYKDYCAAQVAALRGDERYEGRGGEQLRAEVALYERSLDRAGRMLIEWSRLNIDDRLARIEEAKAVAILEVIRQVLLAAELDETKRAFVENVAIEGLKAIGTGR